LNEHTGVAADAAAILFNLPDYRVISTTVTAGRRQVKATRSFNCAITISGTSIVPSSRGRLRSAADRSNGTRIGLVGSSGFVE
jgi:hypothetical protein